MAPREGRYPTHMQDSGKQLRADLERALSNPADRAAALAEVADILRRSGNYRWVGLYDVDLELGRVSVIVWSGPGAPAYPTFSIFQGLTGAAISERRTINVGDVTADSRYLTAFGTTRSEIIVPIFGDSGTRVIGTIDVESDRPGAFSPEVQKELEACARLIQPLWTRRA
jgi:GAF domain-containing protein